MKSTADFTVYGKTVLITGAGMGMGRLYALRAAREGAATLILWDVNPVAIAAVGTEVLALGAKAVIQALDLSDLGAIKDAAQELRTVHGIEAPDVLVNNAGIVKAGPFWEHDSLKDTGPTMRINALAPMYVAAEFLPAMMKSGEPGRILNIASAAGTLANPNMSVYAASKWALIGWSDSLRLELQRAGSLIKVTTFCPSYISTGMFEGVKGPLLTPIMTPDIAVGRAWQAMLRAQPFKLTPWTAKLAVALRGVLPTTAWDFVAGNVFKVYSSMDHFTGRQGSAQTPEPAPQGLKTEQSAQVPADSSKGQ
ncbi:SDR family NAD(P)-dependent oxidoreductase [Arthrobacter cryoconiti]|uniref:SDR family NAD(P)-dependent oxidoreductase n=1 Tax=Arthrobacter cryoconiti TaxID=748907 RepID=A0ABV8QXQ5_9MICC|nr:SDR family NAD(P)-dependent oxidoreductase [Arthrobacter cryoconiti]MCC9068734.1 SDR family NAD(P)-dependent oxidoreductase [Arthrobacter cryoconiti]